MTLPLFDPPPEEGGFDRRALAARLHTLAQQGIWIGTSSWKYEGWLGQIYSPERYSTRGRFSQKKFQAECLAEYAQTFPIVCGDFSFYQFPTPEYWQRLFAAAPEGLQFALKVPEEVTAETFPKHARYGPRAGARNQSYLDADALVAQFLEPLRPYASRVAVLLFEFGARGTDSRDFIDALKIFLSRLPKGFRYAIEVRNREFLQPRYFEALRESGVAHVLNSWTRMPPLADQAGLPTPADFTVVRALLRPGRVYEDAVARFLPYDKVGEAQPETRNALRDWIRRMREERRTSYIFVNNRLEGNAPETIRAVVEE